MRLWRPPPDEPQLHEWWLPLLALSRRVRAERMYWPIHIDQFALEGRIDRDPRPAIWVYVHGGSLEELLVDGDGRTYEFIHHRSGRSPGRFKEIPLRRAVWRARLPDHVEPIWYDEPQPRLRQVGDSWWWEDADPDEPQIARGHLRLVVS
jgi:hypothetical protein